MSDTSSSAVVVHIINGTRDHRIEVSDRGFAYGDGVFETVVAVDGKPQWWPLHLQRLQRGCDRLRLGYSQWELLSEEVLQQAATVSRCIIKVVVTRGATATRGYRAPESMTPTRVVSRFPWPAQLVGAEDALVAVCSSVRCGINPSLAGIKHLNRLEQVMALSAPEAQHADEVIMFATDGELVGGGMSNVYLATDAAVMTPPVERHGIAGIVRQRLLERCQVVGVPMFVQSLTREDLLRAQEIMVSNVRWGLRSVRQLDGRVYHQFNWCRRLRSLLDEA